MPRQCSICIHPQRKQIESTHSDASNRRIATQYHVSEAALRRHFSHMQDASLPATPHTDRARVGKQHVKRVSGQNIPDEIKSDVQQAFLDTYIAIANESGACRIVNVSRSTIRYWEEHDETFSMRYKDAKEQVNDAYRGEIFRRGVLGYEEEFATPKGIVVKLKKFSDRELEFGAKARMPEFREKTQLDILNNGQTSADPYEYIRSCLNSRASRYPASDSERADHTSDD